MIDLRFGDCMEVLPTLPAQSVDMVLCDLPYGTTQNKWDSQLDLRHLWPEYRRVCRGAVVLFAQCPFDKVLGMSNLGELRYEWIWEKTNATGHLNARRAPMKAHENILVFASDTPPYYPIKTQGHVRKVATSHRTGNSSNYGDCAKDVPYDSTERFPRSVVQFSNGNRSESFHPTMKPVALCEYLIRTYTREGETVLDNTMGSGTTGVAARNTGRNFIGIEKNPEYFAIACERLA